jgi:hypothetical protein
MLETDGDLCGGSPVDVEDLPLATLEDRAGLSLGSLASSDPLFCGWGEAMPASAASVHC